jgi:hypothetical protein
MKTIITIFCLFFAALSFGQDYILALESSIERSKGASGASVVYKVHLTANFVETLRGAEFDTGKLVYYEGKPVYFELTNTVGEEKYSATINLESTKFVEFEVSYIKGNCEISFDFYY